ncbi:MAG: hypothetical protein IV090_07885 [Candidatus Sericytochromatia bacterium]|nr:hypothetical protein [Candidatus Sericytochromatia bacterium]
MNPAKFPQAKPLLSTQGAPYRQEVMARWQEKTRIPTSEMAGRWQALSEAVGELQRALKIQPIAA